MVMIGVGIVGIGLVVVGLVIVMFVVVSINGMKGSNIMNMLFKGNVNYLVSWWIYGDLSIEELC